MSSGTAATFITFFDVNWQNFLRTNGCFHKQPAYECGMDKNQNTNISVDNLLIFSKRGFLADLLENGTLLNSAVLQIFGN